jgi:NAD(P)H-hydrate epimerase
VLKGPHTLVATPRAGAVVSVCDHGNPGMATGGTGDVLAGTLGALLVQTGDLELAVRAGVLLHALAGDDAAKEGERGTVAGDLLPHLRAWANPS